MDELLTSAASRRGEDRRPVRGRAGRVLPRNAAQPAPTAGCCVSASRPTAAARRHSDQQYGFRGRERPDHPPVAGRASAREDRARLAEQGRRRRQGRRSPNRTPRPRSVPSPSGSTSADMADGIPTVNGLRRRRLAVLGWQAFCWWKKLDFGMTRQLEWGPGSVLDFPLDFAAARPADERGRVSTAAAPDDRRAARLPPANRPARAERWPRSSSPTPARCPACSTRCGGRTITCGRPGTFAGWSRR